MKKILFLLSIICLMTAGCEKVLERGHNQQPYDKLSPATAFNSASNLALYTNSFYNILPSFSEVYEKDQTSDIMQRRDFWSFLVPDGYSADQSGGWSWGDLRNINYFLTHASQAAKNAGIPENTIKNYVGIARFFRAWFYFDKVIRFGGVPWYNKPLDPSDTAQLMKPRDSRELIMDSVLADLNYATANIDDTKDNSCSKITKWVALAFKSRVCLFEGTFRKYHDELGLQSTVGSWLTNAKDAAQAIIDEGLYSIHVNSSDPAKSYSELFLNRSGTPPSDEIILADIASSALGVTHDASYIFTSPTNGLQPSFVKQFINTYLKEDGTRFTDQPGFNSIPFTDEVKDRDLRLQQTIRMGDYARGGVPAPPNWSYTNTGYQPSKFTLLETFADGSSVSDNSIPVIRYAEVLLNYAEAKAELGEFTQTDWNITIKLLRERAGITNTAMPTTADQYLENTFYPAISDPVLLEIRRERAIELAMEGFRFNDLLRWKLGENLEMPWEGMYVPQMNVLYDLNEDGNPDVSFVSEIPANKEPGVVYRKVDGVVLKLSEGDHGNIFFHTDFNRTWKDKKYYYPIPRQERVLNPNLDQNEGWEED